MLRSLALANLVDLGLLLGGLALLLAALYLQERSVCRYVAHRVGWHAILVTAWLGVPVHELSHWLVARLFGHRIVAVRLFDPDPVSGTLGYVRHAHTRRNPWQLLGYFFVAMAPAVAGAMLLAILVWWMLGFMPIEGSLFALVQGPFSPQPWAIADPAGLVAALGAAGRWVWRAAAEHRTAWLPLQLYLGIAIAAHLAPSPADLRGGARGLLVAIAAMMVLGVGAAALGISLRGWLVLLVPIAGLALLVATFQALYVLLLALVLRLVAGARTLAATRAVS